MNELLKRLDLDSDQIEEFCQYLTSISDDSSSSLDEKKENILDFLKEAISNLETRKGYSLFLVDLQNFLNSISKKLEEEEKTRVQHKKEQSQKLLEKTSIELNSHRTTSHHVDKNEVPSDVFTILDNFDLQEVLENDEDQFFDLSDLSKEVGSNDNIQKVLNKEAENRMNMKKEHELKLKRQNEEKMKREEKMKFKKNSQKKSSNYKKG